MRASLVEKLKDGPRESRELGVSPEMLRAAAEEGFITIDPDAFPDDYVPFNPFIARLPGDTRSWEGWKRWNV